MPEKGKKSLPISENAHKRLKILAAKRGTTIIALIDELAESTDADGNPGSVPKLEQPPAQTGKTKQPTAASSRHAEWHRLLDIILDHGTPEDVIGIQANLKWGAGAVEGRDLSAGRRRKKIAS